MSRMRDTQGRIITRKSVTRSMTLSLIGGAAGGLWFLFNAPQQILTILIKNNLGASATELGIFLGVLNFASIIHLTAIYFYSRSRTIKTYWITMGLVHRTLSFVIAASSLYAAWGGNRRICLMVIMASSIMTFMLGNTSGSGWWTWINELIPANSRASYFGKRSSIVQAMNVVAFFSASYALDYFSSDVFIVFAVIYAAAGLLGVTEFILHIFVPEPSSAHGKQPPLTAKRFFTPFKNRNFRTLCIIAGVALLGINISAPFFSPLITDPQQIGAPFIWLGIMFVISQLVWVLVIPFWGTVMDRFGPKPVVMVGMLFPISFLGYLFLTPLNFRLVLPLISFFGGLFAPALYEGLNQTMLAMLPGKERTVYVAWYWGLLGTIQALGPVMGGILLDMTGSINVQVAASIGTVLVAFLIFDTIKTKKEIPFSRIVTAVSSPGVIKTYFNIPVLAKSRDRGKVEKVLHSVKDSKAQIAIDEIVVRLEDADEEVREEAIRALGRIGGDRAVAVLIDYLVDPESLVRVECARALGKIQNRIAVPALIETLRSSDEQLVEASVRALAKIDSQESSAALFNLVQGENSLRIRAAGAKGISERVERITLLQDILEMYIQTDNRVLSKQLAISIGNILGKPGEFYQYLTGVDEAREEAVQRLFRDIKRRLKKFQKTGNGTIAYIIRSTLPQAIELFDVENYSEAFSILNVIFLQLVYRHLNEAVTDERLTTKQLDFLYKEAPRLYAGYVVMRWLRDAYEEKRTECREQDVLLLFYTLKYYRNGEKFLDDEASGDVKS